MQPPTPSSPVDRRAFVGPSAVYFLASALAAACGGEAAAPTGTTNPGGTTTGGGTPPAGQAGVTISGSTVSVNVAQAGIATAGQFVIVQGADAIVVNIGTGFVALSKTCTHSSCGLWGFDNGSGLLECNSHGSRFRTNGQVAVGPATTPLRSYTVSANGGVVSFTV